MHILFFFFNDTATTEIYTGWYTLSLHDALPIFRHVVLLFAHHHVLCRARRDAAAVGVPAAHLHRHRDPCDLAGPADHAADGRRPAAYLPRHLGDRRRACRPRGGADGAAVRYLSADRPAVRSAHFHDLRARRARQHDRRLHRGLHHRGVHRGRQLVLRHGVGLRHRVPVLHGGDLHPAAGPVRGQIVKRITPATII